MFQIADVRVLMTDERERIAAEFKRAFAELPLPAVSPSQIAPRAMLTKSPLPACSPANGSISFTLPLLRAVLSGHKTETRRPVRPAPMRVEGAVSISAEGATIPPIAKVGDRLWVREKWARLDDGAFAYAVDAPSRPVRWISSRFMPRAAARYFLQVEGVTNERLSAIDEEGALAEGAAADQLSAMYGPNVWFLSVWNAIYGETEFASANDPWVWVLKFALVRS